MARDRTHTQNKRRHKHCALAVVRRTHKQTNTQTDRHGQLQYTAQLSTQCNNATQKVALVNSTKHIKQAF